MAGHGLRLVDSADRILGAKVNSSGFNRLATSVRRMMGTEMKHFTVAVELEERAPSEQRVRSLLAGLRLLQPTIGTSPRGWLEVKLTVPGDSLAQAAFLATAAVGHVTGRPPSTVAERLPAAANPDGTILPNMMSVAEAAWHLGVPEEAVIKIIENHTLPAFKVDGLYAVPRSAVERFGARNAPSPD